MKNIKLITLLLFIVFVGFFSIPLLVTRTLSDKAIIKIANKVVNECKENNETSDCYEEMILSIAPKISMVDSFKITKQVQDQDPYYAYCHVLAHKLSFLEAKRRPNDWKDIVTECPVNMCNYGCLHGSLIERYRGEVLDDDQVKKAVPELSEICEKRNSWNPSLLDQSMCYHALGHLAMYMTNADIGKSLNFCESIGIKNDGRSFYETCIEGVFMTVFQGIDPDEIALVAKIKPTKETVKSFCARYKGDDFEACNRESFPLFFDEFKNPKSLSDFCSYSKTEHGIWKCYATAVGNVTISFMEKQDFKGLENYCLKTNKPSQCFANSAVRILQTDVKYADTSLSICNDAIKQKLGNECYQDLISFFNNIYEKGSDGIINFCNQIPDELMEVCLSNNGNYD